METTGGNSLTFGKGVLMCLLGEGKIIWGVKFRGPKCAICGLKFAVGQIICGLIFLLSW